MTSTGGGLGSGGRRTKWAPHGCSWSERLPRRWGDMWSDKSQIGLPFACCGRASGTLCTCTKGELAVRPRSSKYRSFQPRFRYVLPFLPPAFFHSAPRFPLLVSFFPFLAPNLSPLRALYPSNTTFSGVFTAFPSPRFSCAAPARPSNLPARPERDCRWEEGLGVWMAEAGRTVVWDFEA